MSHGTLNGYREHRKAGLEPCEPCRRAYERLYGPDAPRADGQPIKPWHPDETRAFERGQAGARAMESRWRPKWEAYQERRQPPEGKYCGTPYGYTRHLRDKIPACQPCKDAHAAYERDRVRRNTPA